MICIHETQTRRSISIVGALKKGRGGGGGLEPPYELWYVLARILKGLEDGKPVFSSGTGTLTYNLGLLYNLLLTLPVPIPDEEKKLT